MARTSACQSWMALPLAICTLLAGRHLTPVLVSRNHFRTSQVRKLAWDPPTLKKWVWLRDTYPKHTHLISPSRSTTIPLSVVHSLTPPSLTAGFLFLCNSPNLVITSPAISSPFLRPGSGVVCVPVMPL